MTTETIVIQVVNGERISNTADAVRNGFILTLPILGIIENRLSLTAPEKKGGKVSSNHFELELTTLKNR